MAVIKSVEEKYMKEALKQAKKAYALGEVPIGCVIVHEGKIIGRGYNRRNTDKNTLAHAEITGAHLAGFQGHIERAFFQTPVADHFAGFVDRCDLCVRRCHCAGPYP